MESHLLREMTWFGRRSCSAYSHSYALNISSYQSQRSGRKSRGNLPSQYRIWCIAGQSYRAFQVTAGIDFSRCHATWNQPRLSCQRMAIIALEQRCTS
jgi:hypothetical protein